MSTFGGIEMGKQALNAFRLGMQTVGHNISNMGTEGYSRQKVNYTTVTPMDIGSAGQLGQGVQIDEITRIRDEFLDFQFRNAQADLGYWEEVSKLYDSIQNYISEPANSGIRTAMDNFFNDMQSLQQSPEDVSVRRSLVTSANTLGDMLGALADNFSKYNDSVNNEVQQAVADANRMLYEVAALNKEIYNSEALGENPNDLRDQRDVIIDKLSKMMDIEYTEPIETNGVSGEFFLTLNGKTLVQGQHVRELVAHAFTWNNKIYYDVQVSENEFNIVDNIQVADALGIGAEGAYVLSVDRISSESAWKNGGGDAHCLETHSVTTSEFDRGIILNSSAEEITYNLTLRTLNNEDPVKLDIAVNRDASGWAFTASINDTAIDMTKISNNHSDDGNLKIQDLYDLINDIIIYDQNASNVGSTDGMLSALTLEINSSTDPTMLTINSESQLNIIDYTGMLGALSEVKAELEDVNMRSRPAEPDEALNITGSFRIQVGTQGSRVASKIFRASANSEFGDGEILREWNEGDTQKYTFRVGVSDGQVDFNVQWNKSTKQWILTSDFGNSANVGDVLTVEELRDFMEETISGAITGSNALQNLKFGAGPTNGIKTQFYIDSSDCHLISVSDVVGNLAEKLGIVNENPVIEIDVNENDSLETIRNKINEKYQEEFGLTEPEQWVHAQLHQDDDNTWYMTIESNVAGEAQRITLMGASDGNMQVLRRLGFTSNERISDDDSDPNFREITFIPLDGVSDDASFTLNGVRYLSADNMFNEARRIPAENSKSDYTADTLTTFCDGMWLNLKDTGLANITIRHHVRNGSIKSMEEIRDSSLVNINAAFDEMAYGLVKNVNAYQYSGYGVAKDSNVTGYAFFDVINSKTNAAQKVNVSSEIISDNSLIGAAMGYPDDDGKAVYGKTGGAGDGTNASRIVSLTYSKVMENGTMSIAGVYDALLSEIGSEAGHADLMYSTQATVSDQINTQRQSVSGVNIDEELVDIVILNRAFGAMARYVNAMDEMLNTLINGFGLVGR